ncbi:molybdopterin-guanine dinucleotide biosynthesis protein B [Peptococcaceae bacterium]|nr:molybdopterin-guanine dinucleotide biosynthesis protein B [Peptococcaceae bacterium]
MKVFSVVGASNTGKTTTIEAIISELRRRKYTVGSIKNIHFEKFCMDTEGTDTDRHKKSGSQLVTARGLNETDVLFPYQLDIESILKFYDHDYVIFEGVSEYNVPKILCACSKTEIEERLTPSVFAISGVISNEIKEYKGLPVFNPLADKEKLVDYIVEKVFRKLLNVSAECCSLCGLSCEDMLVAILRGEKTREECLYDKGKVKLFIGNEEIPMVPFVKDIISKTVIGMVSALRGYKEHHDIKIEIKRTLR